MTDTATETTEVQASATETVQQTAKMTDADIKWREKYKVTKQELEASKAASEKEKREIASKVEATVKEKTQLEQKWVEAELKAEATAAGLKDLDLTKLIDVSGVKINEGRIEGLKEAIESFKTKKPEYFGNNKLSSSSSNAGIPNTGSSSVQTKSAWDMDKKEYESAKMRLVGGRMR